MTIALVYLAFAGWSAVVILALVVVLLLATPRTVRRKK